MSTVRHGQLGGYPRDVDDWPLCRFCGERCPSRRHTFCSGHCIGEWQIRSSPAYARECVRARDNGVCGQCQRETLPLYEQGRQLERPLPSTLPWSGVNVPEEQRAARVAAIEAAVAAYDEWAAEMQALGFRTVKSAAWLKDRSSRSFRKVIEGWFWQADHITPVAEGGGMAGLENLQTLCTPCHLAKTKAQAGRRKQADPPVNSSH